MSILQLLQRAQSRWESASRETAYGVVIGGFLLAMALVAGGLRLFPWDRHLLPFITVDMLVWDIAEAIAAATWFRMSWTLTPEELPIRESLRLHGSAFLFPAIITSITWLVIVFLENGSLIPGSFPGKIGWSILGATIGFLIVFGTIDIIATVAWAAAIMAYRFLGQCRFVPTTARPPVE